MNPPPLSAVHLYKAYPPVRGGIEGHVDLLTRQLGARGVAAEVLCARVSGTPRDEVRGGVAVHRCWTPLTLASTPLPPLLPWALRRSQAAIVHLHYPWPPNQLAWLLGGRGRPLVVSAHCDIVRQARLAQLLAPLTQRVFGSAARILVSDVLMRDEPLLAAHRARVVHIPLGVDTARLRPDSGAPDPVPAVGRPRILFVGRLRHYKGLPILAAALARLPTAQLLIAGDGPERPALEAALQSAGCRARAHLLGEVDDDTLLRLYQTSDVAVLSSTSRAEAFGLAIAEAQSCGLPAVTTEVGTGTAQTIADGLSGRLVAPNDPQALADALAWCLDPTRTTALRTAARAHAEQYLSAERMTDAVVRVYEEVAGPR